MRRRGTATRAVGFAAAGAAVLAGAAVVATSAAPLAAGSPIGSSIGTAVQSGPGSGSGPARVEMAALQRDLSLTAGQAGTRVKKDATAGGTERLLRQVLGPQFGGAWVSSGGALTVGVTSADAEAAVRRAGAVPKRVARSESQLSAYKTELDRTSVTDPGVTSWYVDPASNQVVVTATAGDQPAARALATDSGVPASAVRVVTAKAAPRLMFDVKGGDAYFIDQQFRCSVGFSVQGGFVSAGHCGRPGSTTTGFNQKAQGTFKASTFPGNGDFSFVAVNGDWTPQPVVATKQGDIAVAGSQEVPVGAAICRTGSTTGTHCGVVQAKNATVRYPEGTVTGLTQTNVCAEGGDSGGSWMSGDQAQGVTSGGSGDCTQGGTTFFQPLNEILTTDKLTLVTTTDQAIPPSPPPSTDPPASEPPASAPPAFDPPASADPPSRTTPPVDCGNGSRFRGRGLLGELANFFRSRGGRQQACINGVPGTRITVSLQRWNGQQWQTVAQASTEGTATLLTFDGPAGFYRYSVAARHAVRVVAP